MRKISLWGCLCLGLGAWILAGVGCSSDAKSKESAKTADSTTPPVSTNPTGPSSDFVKLCQDSVRIMARGKYCERHDGFDIYHEELDEEDRRILEEELEEARAECARIDLSICANLNLRAWEACLDSADKAADCPAVVNVGSSSDCTEICSGPNWGGGDVDWVEFCKLSVEATARFYGTACNGKPDAQMPPEAQILAEMDARIASRCNTPENAKEHFSRVCADAPLAMENLRTCVEYLREATTCTAAWQAAERCNNEDLLACY